MSASVVTPVETRAPALVLDLPAPLVLPLSSLLDVRSLASLSSTCRGARACFSADAVWAAQATLWGGPAVDTPAGALVRAAGESAKAFFVRACFSTRFVPLSASSVYAWGPGYACTVTGALFTADGLALRCSARGSGSLGELQPARRSRIVSHVTWRRDDNSEQQDNREHDAQRAIASVDEPNRWDGWLTFPRTAFRPGLRRELQGPASRLDIKFLFGLRNGGYQEVLLFTFDAAFKETHRIGNWL